MRARRAGQMPDRQALDRRGRRRARGTTATAHGTGGDPRPARRANWPGTQDRGDGGDAPRHARCAPWRRRGRATTVAERDREHRRGDSRCDEVGDRDVEAERRRSDDAASRRQHRSENSHVDTMAPTARATIRRRLTGAVARRSMVPAASSSPIAAVPQRTAGISSSSGTVSENTSAFR